MKKKIVYIILCLISLFVCSDIKAESRACTQDDISEARRILTINSSQRSKIPIPTLGRTGEANKAYVYKMSLGGHTSLCLDSGSHAKDGTEYTITHEITDLEWKKAYQYAIKAKASDDDINYAIAQAQMWLLNGESASVADPLFEVAKDVYYNYNCNKLLNNESQCDALLEVPDSTNAIKNALAYKYGSNGNSIISDFDNGIHSAVDQYRNSTDYYSGRLYYWKAYTYQSMLSTLDCDDTPDRLYCTDSNGNKHYYTDDSEYNQCIQSGGNKTVCKSSFDLKYCNGGDTGKKYIVNKMGNDAVCTNYDANIGTYYEYVESGEGTAIPGKGDSESEIQINSHCNLYCLENSAQQVFPGNIRTAVSVGTYIIWPTSESTLSSKYKNYYPLSFSGQKTCYVVMSGENNPINETSLTEYYNTLVSNIPNNTYGSYAKKTYEASRLSNGGCNTVYENACKSYNNTANSKYNTWQNYINSDKYKNAVDSKNKKDGNNLKVNSCNQENEKNKNSALQECEKNKNNSISDCDKAKNNCTDSKKKCNDKSVTCKGDATIEYETCIDSVNKGNYPEKRTCGSIENTSSENEIINLADKYETDYETAKSQSNTCTNERAACNNYTDKVNELIEFSKQLKTCATYTPSCSGTSCDIYKYSTNVDLSWSDSDYGTIITDSQLEKSINYYLNISSNNNNFINVSSNQGINTIKSNLSNLINQVKNVTNNRQIKANVNVTYSLPTTNLLYNYVVVASDGTIKAQTNEPSSNYSAIGFSNLPISYKALTNVSYELKLSNIKFGENGQYSPKDYTCNYKVKSTPSISCLCDSTTPKFEGKDLSDIVINENLTCSEAKEKYCKDPNPPTPTPTPKTCKDYLGIEHNYTDEYNGCILSGKDSIACISELNDKYCSRYCPNDPSVDLLPCLRQGKTLSWCYNKFCVPPSKWTCKQNDGSEVDITECVQTGISQEKNETETLNSCETTFCPPTPPTPSGVKIIYRTISLENPFPSKTADANITQKGLTVGMFNDDVKGRYPGINWNDQKLVQNHILTVTRNKTKIDGSNIYQSEPLYRFELNTATINAIRDYNEKREENGGYDDFTLECRLGNSKACVSEKFVHKKDLSGLVSGLCMNSTSKTNFYQCSGDD